MIPAAKEQNIQLLCYGTLLGGFLSSQWLGQPEPDGNSLTNVSLRKYLPWIQIWGGWSLFQVRISIR
jgi:aryl-alcohol dehydrogenase-like predicted oxidoreductase